MALHRHAAAPPLTIRHRPAVREARESATARMPALAGGGAGIDGRVAGTEAVPARMSLDYPDLDSPT
jgi:hypothetical protein